MASTKRDPDGQPPPRRPEVPVIDDPAEPGAPKVPEMPPPVPDPPDVVAGGREREDHYYLEHFYRTHGRECAPWQRDPFPSEGTGIEHY